MFPSGYSVNYSIDVSYLGGAVPATTVNCRRQSAANAFQVGGEFIEPAVATSAPVISVTSDPNGNAKLDGMTLTLGAGYLCEAFLKDARNSDVLSGQVTFVVGVDAPNLE